MNQLECLVFSASLEKSLSVAPAPSRSALLEDMGYDLASVRIILRVKSVIGREAWFVKSVRGTLTRAAKVVQNAGVVVQLSQQVLHKVWVKRMPQLVCVMLECIGGIHHVLPCQIAIPAPVRVFFAKGETLKQSSKLASGPDELLAHPGPTRSISAALEGSVLQDDRKSVPQVEMAWCVSGVKLVPMPHLMDRAPSVKLPVLHIR